MSLVKLEFGAKKVRLEKFIPRGKGQFYEVDCPFCETNQCVQTRKFHQGIRCINPRCQAMLYFPTKTATQDMLPRELTIMVHGMRTRIDWEAEGGAAR